MSYTKSYYHLVIGTYRRHEVLDIRKQKEFFSYVVGVFKSMKSYVFSIGGYTNHYHVAFDLHPTIALATLVKELKLASNYRIKTSKIFADFESWSRGYFAASFSDKDLQRIRKYIENQIPHHNHNSFEDELKGLLDDNDITYNPDFM